MNSKENIETVSPYQMTLSLNVLNHLGIYLYSNVPSVLSEVVANSWDADAENVSIIMHDNEIIISDDGHGMNEEDINDKYLFVGYERRSKKGETETPRWHRQVMGRKGIGKLSLFSIAEYIELYSIKANEKNAFLMSINDIKSTIENKESVYRPTQLKDFPSDLTSGTRIKIYGLKRRHNRTASFLRKRLARRFSILRSKFHFELSIDGLPVTLKDRDYFHKLEYIWYYGKESDLTFVGLEKASEKFLRTNIVTAVNDESDQSKNKTYSVKGWIGSVKEAGDLKDEYDNLNKIVVMVRGKMADEDVLKEFNEGGVFSKYLIGEIDADFLDLNEESDIATSSRQEIMHDDPRYSALLDFIRKELKVIQNSWTSLRNKKGTEEALTIPAIKEWFATLKNDDKKQAEKLFGKFNEIPNDPEIKKRLFKYGVLAFESLRYKSALSAIDKMNVDDIEKFGQLFGSLDDIEAGLYRQIVTERIKVIQVMREKVNEKQLEKAIQYYLYDHLWLLDPSWERAAGNAEIETSLGKKFNADKRVKLDKEAMKGRLDIKYKTVTGKHVIIELKKPDRVIKKGELEDQGDKYENVLRELLNEEGKANEPIEVVFLVGSHPKNWSNPNQMDKDKRSLAVKNYRILTYAELLNDASRMYSDYLKKKEEINRIEKILAEIDESDFT